MLRKPLTVAAEAALAVPAAPAPEAVLVDVVVLTADPELFESARDAVGERNPVWRARSSDEAADLLITGRCGVLLVDMAAVSTRADTLIQQIVEQFPDVIVCVAGTRADEPLLAPLISDGLVYRFMHKPASARRAGMFLQAAIRRHVERREGRAASDPLLPLLRGLRRPTAGMPRGYLALIGLVALAVTVPFFVGGEPDPLEVTATIAVPVVPAAGDRDDRSLQIRFSRARGLRCKPAGSRRPKAATRSTCSRPCCSRSRSTPRPRPRWRRRCSCCCNARSRNSTLAARRKPNGWCSACSPWSPITGRHRFSPARSTHPTRLRASCRASSAPRSKRASPRPRRSRRRPTPRLRLHLHLRGRSQKSRPNSLRCRGRSRSCPARRALRRRPRPRRRPRSCDPIRSPQSSSIRRDRSSPRRAATRASR